MFYFGACAKAKNGLFVVDVVVVLLHFCWPDPIFFLAPFLSVFSPRLLLLAFALNNSSDSPQKFGVNHV